MKPLQRCVMVWACVCMSWAQAQLSLRPELAKPVQAAQSLLAAQKPVEALGKIDEAKQLPALTEEELVLLRRLESAAALDAKQNERAAQALQALLSSSKVSTNDKETMVASLVAIYQSSKQNKALIETLKTYFKQGGSNPRFRLPLAQALAIEKDYQAALDELDKKSQSEPGAKPSEAELRVAIYAQSRMKNDAALLKTLQTTVKLYPKPDYWSDLAAVLLRKPGLSKRHELDVYRLMEEVGVLTDEEDYLEAMDVALKTGLPKDALRWATQAKQAGVVSAANQTKLQTLQAQAFKASQEDAVFKNAMPKTANEMAQLADLYLSEHEFEKAAERYDSALKMGGLKYESEVWLHLGVALYKMKRFAQAQQALTRQTTEAPILPLADIWVVLFKP